MVQTNHNVFNYFHISDSQFLFPFQVFDEIDIRKFYLDVDKTFKKKRGITLSLPQWRKLANAVNYVDRRLENARKEKKNHWAGILIC